MNAKKLEQWTLLEQSGELSTRHKKELDRCPEAAIKRRELRALQNALPQSEREPSPWASARIQERLQPVAHRRIARPAHAWQPLLAALACITLVLTTFKFTPTVSSTSLIALAAEDADVWNVQFEEELVQLEGLILAISDASRHINEM